MGNIFKRKMNDKWKMMNDNKNKLYNIHYKKSNLKIHHHNWPVDLLGLTSLHNGILPQIIFYSLMKVNLVVFRKLVKLRTSKNGRKKWRKKWDPCCKMKLGSW
jgi:hypothetical protein